MSSINPIGTNSGPNSVISSAATNSSSTKKAPTTATPTTGVIDPDHDGDSDGGGLDVKG
ncbi:MAG TPA: hypothetical protein VFC46_02900 [Humisphaera sp.]|nr:hypothetical protein [Humisphaera sp.]